MFNSENSTGIAQNSKSLGMLYRSAYVLMLFAACSSPTTARIGGELATKLDSDPKNAGKGTYTLKIKLAQDVPPFRLKQGEPMTLIVDKATIPDPYRGNLDKCLKPWYGLGDIACTIEADVSGNKDQGDRPYHADGSRIRKVEVRTPVGKAGKGLWDLLREGKDTAQDFLKRHEVEEKAKEIGKSIVESAKEGAASLKEKIEGKK